MSDRNDQLHYNAGHLSKVMPTAHPCAQAAYVHDYARRCSRIARAFSIGKSVHGADLWVLELGASRGQDVGKPRFKYLVRRRVVPCPARQCCSVPALRS